MTIDTFVFFAALSRSREIVVDKKIEQDTQNYLDSRDGMPAIRAVWSGTFKLFGVEVKCHTLSNGQRVIEADSMEALFAAMGNGTINPDDNQDVTEFAKWQRVKP